MTSNLQRRFDKIEDYISCGLVDQAIKEINYIKKKVKLSDEQKIKVSVWLHWLGCSDKALKILGSPLTKRELEVVENLSVVKKNARIAHMLSFSGAVNMAQRLYDDLDDVIKSRQMVVNEFYPQYYNSLGNHYLRKKDYEKSYYFFSQYKNESLDFDSKTFFNLLGLCDSLHNMGSSEEAFKKAIAAEEQVPNKGNLMAIYYQAIGEYCLGSGSNEKGLKYLKKSQKLFMKNNIETKDYAYLDIAMSKTTDNRDEKRTFLLQAKKILEKGLVEPQVLYETLSLLAKNGEKLSFLEEVAVLNTLMCERTKVVHIIPNQGQIDITTYREGLVKKNGHSIIDLKGSHFYSNLECREKLSPQEVCIIAKLTLASYIGIHEMALVDCVYNVGYYGREKMISRLKKSIMRLKKKTNLPIKWQKRYLYLDIDKVQADIILPSTFFTH